MSVEFVEEVPPSGTGVGRGVVSPVVAALRKRPGEWAIVYSNPKRTNAGTRHARLRDLGCEAVTRKQPDGTFKVYARWPKDGQKRTIESDQ